MGQETVETITKTWMDKPVTLSGMLIVRVREGQVVDCWNSMDFLPLLITFGLAPSDSVDKALAPG